MEGSNSHRLASFLALVLAVACTIAPLAQPQSNLEVYLDLHNAARSDVGVGPVSWSDTVAEYALDYAYQRAGDCKLIHSHGPYGENIYWGYGEGYDGAEDAMRYWVDEKKYYDYEKNTCMAREQCGHYTQIVWRSSTRIGCARVDCTDDVDGRVFITCNYDPPGNYIGQRPY